MTCGIIAIMWFIFALVLKHTGDDRSSIAAIVISMMFVCTGILILELKP